MDKRISIRLTGPAKINRVWRKAGETVSVTLDEASQLKEVGVLAVDGPIADLVPGMPGFNETVNAVTRSLADAAVNVAVQKAEAQLIEERDAAVARAVAAEAKAVEVTAKLAALEATIAAPAGEASDKPRTPTPTAIAAKPAGKSGAAKKS